MRHVGEWTKARRLPNEYREVVTSEEPLPKSVRLLGARSEFDMRLSLGVAWAMFLIFVPLTLVGLVGALVNPHESRGPFWIDFMPIGIFVGLSGVVAGHLLRLLARRRKIREGRDRDGLFFFPDALVQRFEEMARVFPASSILRFTYETWRARSGERNQMRTFEEVRVHVLSDGEEEIHVIECGALPHRELLEACRSWHRDASGR